MYKDSFHLHGNEHNFHTCHPENMKTNGEKNLSSYYKHMEKPYGKYEMSAYTAITQNNHGWNDFTTPKADAPLYTMIKRRKYIPLQERDIFKKPLEQRKRQAYSCLVAWCNLAADRLQRHAIKSQNSKLMQWLKRKPPEG